MQRFVLNGEKSVISRTLYSTENSIFDGKNNQIRRNEGRFDRHETSLTKNSVNTPSNLKRLTFMQSQDEHKGHNFSLPKTAATISNKTEHFITSSNQTINGDATAEVSPPSYDKKHLSKQLLSQIHFCRFLYKLTIRMRDKLSPELNEEMAPLKEYMAGLVFEKLEEVNSLKAVNTKHAADYKCTPDYHKIAQIIEQYVAKYNKDLSSISQLVKPLSAFKEQLTKSIVGLYERVGAEEEEGSEWKEEVIVLDYLVTLRQLLGLLQGNDMEGFHNKSKIETIVEGAPSKVITQEHLNAIRAKLKAIKII
jgi:hypothetical protein